jgi:hypothetical protein
MIIGTGMTQPCRLCLAKYAGKLDTKKDIARTRRNWGFSTLIQFFFSRLLLQQKLRLNTSKFTGTINPSG